MSKPEKQIHVGQTRPLWWDDPNFTHVRIDLDFSDPRHHYQRHVWTRHDGSEMAEDWIRTAGG